MPRKDFERMQLAGVIGKPIDGYGRYGATYAVVLYIGRKAGLTYGGWREGQAIPDSRAVQVVSRRREQQIGSFDATITHAEGYYRGKPEESIQVRIIFVPSPRERTFQAFSRNIRQLAQRVAADLAQREVLIDWQVPGKAIRTDTASPLRAPAATDEKKFCAWVRKHSESARKDPDDSCYQAPARRKR